jgi:predicted transcriptional regulator
LSIIGLLKLCLSKEISSKLIDDNIEKLHNIIGYIMKILKNGYIETSENIKETIKEVLKKMKGSNILNFSDYVDETIDMNQTDKLMKLLDKDDFKKINDIRYRLSKYNKYIEFFNKKFEKAKKESIFEFSVV